MSKFEFSAAINVRAYGVITVEAENLDLAKAILGGKDFRISDHWEPNGGGDNDYDLDHPRPEIHLYNVVNDETQEEMELVEDVPDSEPQFMIMCGDFHGPFLSAASADLHAKQNGFVGYTIQELISV